HLVQSCTGGAGRLFLALAGMDAADADAALETGLRAGARGIVLHRCVGLRDVQHLSAKLAVHEAEQDLAEGAIDIVAVVADTAAGILALPSLAGAPLPRLLALACDTGLLRAELGCGPDAAALRSAAAATVTCAAAAGAVALAIASAEDQDDSLRELRRDGFGAVLVRTAPQAALARRIFAEVRPLPGVSG
ncbi:aldolase, partial [Enterovirga sp.]|uniref:aldolase n=1 Tax=Enterovirga sp. TaxID=2026350 RepID=UPI002634C169